MNLLVERTHLNEGDARTYVEGMSEYQTYLNRNGTQPFKARHFQLNVDATCRWRTTEDGRIEHSVSSGSQWCNSAYRTVEELLDVEAVEEVFPS